MRIYIIIAICLCFSVQAYSQINPLGSAFYQNQYMLNPAMAGTEDNWVVAGAYKAQWTAIEGAPLMQSVTGEYGSESKKVGVGFNLYNEQLGAIRRTSLKGTYAYHLPLNSESTNFLDFGLSLGVMSESIDFSKVTGDMTDPSLINFNQRGGYLDGDFGVAYRTEKLTVQGSFPNLKRIFKRDLLRDVADKALFFSSVAYKFNMENSSVNSIEPKIAFRGVQNYKSIVDAGVNVSMAERKLVLSGIYHSSESFTVGIGTVYKERLSILGQYTSNTAAMKNYSNSEFEISVRFAFPR